MTEIKENGNLSMVFYFLAAVISTGFLFALPYRDKEKDYQMLEQEPEDVAEQKDIEERTSYWQSLHSYFKIVFGLPEMRYLLLSHLLVSIPTYAMFAFTADKAFVVGLSEHECATIVGIVGITECLALPVFGYILDYTREFTFTLVGVALVIEACLYVIFAFMTSFFGHALVLIGTQMAFSAYSSSTYIVLKAIDEKIFTEVYGMHCLMDAFAILIANMVVGQIVDHLGSYRLNQMINHMLTAVRRPFSLHGFSLRGQRLTE